MSDFLLNLARRGAGLTPVVRSRPPAVADSPVGAVETDAEPVQETTQADRMVPVPQMLQTRLDSIALEPSPAPIAPSVIAPPAAAPSLVAPPVVASPHVSPITYGPPQSVQRAVLPGAPTPFASLAPAVSANGRSPVPAAPRATPTRSPHDEAASTIPQTEFASPWTPPESPVDPWRPAERAPAGAPFEPLDPVGRPADVRPRPVSTIEPIVKPTRLVDPAIADDTGRPVVMVESAPLPAAAIAPAPARDAAPAPERVVHVRIGAIEIHAASPAPAPLPPSISAAAMQATPIAGDFDRFARLRCYAPWES